VNLSVVLAMVEDGREVRCDAASTSGSRYGGRGLHLPVVAHATKHLVAMELTRTPRP
jgi:hypothetical protein